MKIESQQLGVDRDDDVLGARIEDDESIFNQLNIDYYEDFAIKRTIPVFKKVRKARSFDEYIFTKDRDEMEKLVSEIEDQL